MILVLFVMGEFAEREIRYGIFASHPGRAFHDTVNRVAASLPRPLDDTGLQRSGLPIYDLRIEREELARFHRTIEAVQARGNTDGIPPLAYERAYFRSGGDWVPIRVKLRGWTSSHYDKAHPSIRLKFQRNRLFEGKRLINLVDPYDKFISADVTTKWEAQQHGLLGWDSRFVVLRVNGALWGMYLELEQPSRELLEHNGRPEGHIFSPNGTLYGKHDFGYDKAASALRRCQLCAVNEPPGELCDWTFVEESFDTDRMAWAAAIMSLSGHWGAWLADNLHLYYDPARGKFEPIPWDYGYLRLTREDSSAAIPYLPPGSVVMDGESACELGVAMLRVPEFRQMRDERLWILVNERIEPMVAYAEALFESISVAASHDGRYLRSSVAREMHQDFVATLRANAALLRELFSENSLRITYSQPALSRSSPSVWPIHIENRGKAAVQVMGLLVAIDGQPQRRPLLQTLRLPGRWRGQPGSAQLEASLPPGAELEGVVVENVLTGQTMSRDEIHMERRTAPMAVAHPAPPGEPPLELQVRGVAVQADEVRFGPGIVELRQSVEIPARFAVVVEPGTEIHMFPSVSLIVHGDFRSIGSADRPIRIRGEDGNPSWGTLAVQGERRKPSRVTLAYTVIEGGSGGETERVRFTAALAVHDGVVVLRHVRLLNALADDAINLKYATVEVEDCFLESHADDGIDLDFCTGTVRRCAIVGVGGDALDLSGSQMTIEENDLTRFGDKGISVGEQSQGHIRNNRLSSGVTGVAVKDDSFAKITDTWLSHLEVGISAYVKKPSFGGSTVIVNDVVMEAVEGAYLRDAASSLTVDRPAAGGSAALPPLSASSCYN